MYTRQSESHSVFIKVHLFKEGMNCSVFGTLNPDLDILELLCVLQLLFMA